MRLYVQTEWIRVLTVVAVVVVVVVVLFVLTRSLTMRSTEEFFTPSVFLFVHADEMAGDCHIRSRQGIRK